MNSGANHPPVEKSRESYTARFVYQDNDAKKIGSGSENYGTVAGYKAGIAASPRKFRQCHGPRGHPGPMTRTPTRSPRPSSATTANNEIYLVTFGREQVSVSSYEDDGILSVIETWADGSQPLPEVRMMDTSVLITLRIPRHRPPRLRDSSPGFLVMWDRVLAIWRHRKRKKH